MNNVLMYIVTYILILSAITLTVALAFVLIVGRSKSIRDRVFNKELNEMTRRIEERYKLNGKATNHEVDLSSFEKGGWTGEFDSKKPIDLGLNKPHPFYNRGADNE